MANNYLLKYKTFDELLDEVRGDFEKYDQNGMIDSSKLIKIAQLINKRLGNKLRQDKETILYVEKGKVRLPEDFHMLNIAFLIHDYTVTSRILTGAQREYVTVTSVVKPDACVDPCPPTCYNPCVRLTECGTEYEILETKQYEKRKYKHFSKLHIKPGKSIMPGCINTEIHCEHSAYIKNNFLHTSFDEGKIYMSYLGAMEDDNGNLLVLDHELVNPYYEYTLKRRILENLYIEGEDVSQKITLIESRYKEAKVEAETLMNTPDAAEMDLFHKLNRKAMYQKYYYIFK